MKDIALINRRDFIIILILLLFSISSLAFVRFNSNNAKSVTVTVDKKEVFSVNLRDVYRPISYKIESEGKSATVIIYRDGAELTENDCKNKICVHSGKISKSGQSIVCIPKKIVVEISGNKLQNPVTY